MAEPQSSLEWVEWAKLLAGSATTAVGAAWSFMRSARQELVESIKDSQARMTHMENTMATQATDVAVLKANAENHVERLDEIRQFAKDINGTVKELSGQLTDLLIALKKPQ